MKKFQNHERGKKQRQTMLKNTSFHHSPLPHIVMLLCGQKANFSFSLHFDFSISLMSGIGKSENFQPREKFVLISFLCMICSIFFTLSLFSLSPVIFNLKVFFFAVRTSHHLVIIFSCSTTWCTSISASDWYHVLLTPLFI